MMTSRLPDGFVVRLREDLLRRNGGRMLVGGSPTRVMRLSERALTLIGDGTLTVRDEATAAMARRFLAGNLADPVLDRLPEVAAADLTVVIPVRDRPEQLDRCLAALRGSGGSIEVIVVDDASLDLAATTAVAEHHGARLVALPTNLGPGGARTRGLAHVTTPLVAFVDSDVTASAASLLRLARHCADPEVALVGPVIAGQVRSERPHWFERYDAIASSLDLGARGGQVSPGAAIGWLPSACLVGRVSHLVAAGGFAADLRVAEDVDLVWRLIEAGRVVRYEPSVRVDHDVRASLRGWLGRKFVYGTGGADLGIRHGDRIAPAALSATMALGAAAVMQRRWWSIPAGVATVAVTARSLRRSAKLEGRDGAEVAWRLASRGLGWAVRQEAGLLLRHWWPLAAAAAPVSRPVRRALVTAVLVDAYVFHRERRGVDPVTALAARRMDDVAYGAGLWWGAIRRRDLTCLLPRRTFS